MSPGTRTLSLARWLPLAILVAGLAVFFALGLHDQVSFETLARSRVALGAWVDAHPATAPLIYILVYIVVCAFSLPGAAVLSVTGGFLFGVPVGTFYAVIGATTGACALFLAARTAIGDFLRARAGPALRRMEAGLRRDALSYLFVLRLVPLFPFWLVNLVPAFLGVKLRTYVIATFFGIMPGAFVYTGIGSGLGAVFDAGGEPDLAIVLTPPVLLPLLGLAVLALIPVAYRRFQAGRGASPRS
ncbi:MAG: TVP38/TMEM64 family protein [Pseudomonadota bacterium]